MARSVTRWIVGGVLACCAVAVALLPPKEQRERYRALYAFSDAQRLNRERLRFERALTRLRLLQLKDSLPQRPARVLDPEGRLRLVTDAGIPERTIGILGTLAERSWTRLAQRDTTVSVVIAALIDTAGVVEGFTRESPYRVRSSFLLPSGEESATCFVVIDFGTTAVKDFAVDSPPILNWRTRYLQDGIGPCTYYAAYGLPGSGVARWLATWRHVPAIGTGRTRIAEDERYVRWQGYRGIWLGTNFLGCAAGDRERCRAALWDAPNRRPSLSRRAEFAVPEVLDVDQYWTYGYYSSRHGLGPAAEEYVNDVVGHFGEERFARFWTSNAPLEEAFEQAMGMPLDEWTMQWAQSYVGEFRTADHLPWGSVWLSIVLALAMVGAAGLYAVRREA